MSLSNVELWNQSNRNTSREVRGHSPAKNFKNLESQIAFCRLTRPDLEIWIRIFDWLDPQWVLIFTKKLRFLAVLVKRRLVSYSLASLVFQGISFYGECNNPYWLHKDMGAVAGGGNYTDSTTPGARCVDRCLKSLTLSAFCCEKWIGIPL